MSVLCFNTSFKLMQYIYHICCDVTDVLIIAIVCSVLYIIANVVYTSISKWFSYNITYSVVFHIKIADCLLILE